ncbi:hypothetical protein [Flammeovirga kamogawensis]|uniref:Uncharacterized protein n=1 Tax=Flammeovirga kamogawensis TaxID=373891 RepID=A0ABX8H0B7_9BACT|nr:hypothetical protein [Flammeovirga kamogawensis]MBB6463653.1 hypothetical protein [Flammeovirga kamogawensis]QWG09266.1 hypothetical protein KM029_21925 [Flammeovirga kamogawensis]TRX64789.1 hypothetical protein EO216_19835 [Flammeovirga kamogawensis]
MKLNTNLFKTIVGGTLASFLSIGAIAANPNNNDPISTTENNTAPILYSKHMTDYNSVEEVLKDFSFWGAIDPNSIELKEFETPAGSTTPSSTKKQLKFTIKDRRIPSGFTINPNMELVGKEMRMEMRLVPDKADHDVRFGDGRNNGDVTAGWRVHYKDKTDQLVYTVGNENSKLNDFQKQGFYPGFETLPDADPNFKPDGFVNDWFFYCTSDNDVMKPGSRTPGGVRPMKDTNKRHAAKVNPNVNYVEAPDKAIISQVDILIGGSTYKLWQDPNKFSGYDPETGFPKAKEDYVNVMNFQGDVYITYIEWGDKQVN